MAAYKKTAWEGHKMICGDIDNNESKMKKLVNLDACMFLFRQIL